MKGLTREAKRQRRFGQLAWFVRLSAMALILATSSILEVANQDIQAATKQKEEWETLQVIETVVNAWNRGDADTLSHQFLPDGLVVLPAGTRIQSRSDIKKRVVKERSGRLQDTKLAKTVEKISFRDDNTAIITGRYQLEGVTILYLFEISPQGTFVLEQVRAEGRWMIAKAELQSN